LKLAGVVCVKDQDLHRFTLHLASIAWQIVPGEVQGGFSYTVVDYGSTPAYREKLHPIVEHFGFKVIEVNKDTDPWRHGRAFNIGIRANEAADYIFTTGGDLVFEPDLLSQAIALAAPRVYINAPLSWTKSDSSLSVSKGAYYGTLAFIEKEWWFRRRGYDEDFTHWGREDTDLFERAKQDDYAVRSVTSCAWHQFHPPRFPPETADRNREIYYEKNGNKERNTGCWGELDRYCGDVKPEP
jgi:hypothetical protein